MNNALAVLRGGNAAISTYDEDLEQLLAEEDGGEENAFRFYATQLKFPTGGMTTGFPTTDDSLVSVPFNAVILVAQTNRAWWPKDNGDQTVGGAPLCASRDGVTGSFNMGSDLLRKAYQYPTIHPALPMIDAGADMTLTHFDCATCPLARFVDGKGTPCKELRRLLVLIEGMASPVILTVPTGSLSVFDRYASAQKAQARRYFTVWTRFELEKDKSKMSGAVYARLKLSFARTCTTEEARAVVQVRKEFGELVRKMTVTDVDYNTEPSVIDGTASGVTVEPEPSVPF
jgi:hypothetical protein